MAPQAFIDGEVRVDIFGVAYDDVTSLRVQVGDEWRLVPLVSPNGFYLSLSGVSRDQLGHFEATLEDGTVQVHDLQTGRPVNTAG